jgi:ABC-2 type transport system permease protein
MRALRELWWVETKLFVREPLTVVFVVVLPLVMLYVLNGVFGTEVDPEVWEGRPPVDFYTPSYVALVSASTGVLSVPVHLASYREQGVLRRFQASALPAGVLFAALAGVGVAPATLGAVVLVVASVLSYDAPLPESWVGVLAAHLLVCSSFAALGVLLGLVMPTARTAQGLGVVLFFVFLMLGGAGPPREVLPAGLRAIGDGIPLTYGARTMRSPWLDGAWDWSASVVIGAVLVVSVLLAAWLAAGRRTAPAQPQKT